MQKAQLSSYEQRIQIKLIEAQHYLIVNHGFTRAQAEEKLIEDLANGGSVITPAFVKAALSDD